MCQGWKFITTGWLGSRALTNVFWSIPHYMGAEKRASVNTSLDAWVTLTCVWLHPACPINTRWRVTCDWECFIWEGSFEVSLGGLCPVNRLLFEGQRRGKVFKLKFNGHESGCNPIRHIRYIFPCLDWISLIRIRM